MTDSGASAAARAKVSDERLVALVRRLIQFRSPMFEEGEVADFLAGHLRALGLDVEMMEVPHPTDPGRRTRQPVGRLRGTGGGKSLMVNAHMDTNVVMSGWTVDPYEGRYEDGWVWGLGAQDDKGGIGAMVEGVAAVRDAGIALRGDVVVCPAAAHKLGGTGTRTLLRNGVGADYAINIEHAANTVGSVIVGSVRVKLHATSPGLFFRFTPEARARYVNSIEQQVALVARFGPSLVPIAPGGWLTFEPHPDLPDFPMIRYDAIAKEHYGRDCTMMFQIRTVPGMTLDSVRADVARVIEAAKRDVPELDVEVTIPGNGPDDPYYMEPVALPRDHPLVVAVADGQALGSGRPAEVGGVERIGNFGDGNLLAAAGIPTVQYGPGNIKNYPEWPAPDERCEVTELSAAAKAVAHAIVTLCA